MGWPLWERLAAPRKAKMQNHPRAQQFHSAEMRKRVPQKPGRTFPATLSIRGRTRIGPRSTGRCISTHSGVCHSVDCHWATEERGDNTDRENATPREEDPTAWNSLYTKRPKQANP